MMGNAKEEFRPSWSMAGGREEVGISKVMLGSSVRWAQHVEDIKVRSMAKGLGTMSSDGEEWARTGGVRPGEDGLRATTYCRDPNMQI